MSKEVRKEAAESTPIMRKRPPSAMEQAFPVKTEPVAWTEEQIQASLDMLPGTVGCSDCDELTQKRVAVLYRGKSTNWLVCLPCHKKRRTGRSKPDKMEACGVCNVQVKRIGLYVDEIQGSGIMGAIFICPQCRKAKS